MGAHRGRVDDRLRHLRHRLQGGSGHRGDACSPADTPDGRPGASVLVFAFNAEGLATRLVERVGQTVLTCPTTACFDGLPDAPERVIVGGVLRHFGDKFQSSKVVDGRRYWRVPVMEGEFLVEETFGTQTAIGGGNLLILAKDQAAALAAAEASVDAMRQVRGVILPFPGGIVRAGSKVGAKRYKNMTASTNEAYCPTVRGRLGVTSELPETVNSVLEIVIDGLDRAGDRRRDARRPRRRVPAGSRPDLGGQLRRQAREASLQAARLTKLKWGRGSFKEDGRNDSESVYDCPLKMTPDPIFDAHLRL